jgi:hypothetical protein
VELSPAGGGCASALRTRRNAPHSTEDEKKMLIFLRIFNAFLPFNVADPPFMTLNFPDSPGFSGKIPSR